MKLPYINVSPQKKTIGTDTFYGLNQNIIAQEGEFSYMMNLSDRHYPALSNRPHRGAIEQTFTNPKGIFYKNGLFCIDGTKAYYKGAEKFDVTDSDKTIVGMGAYVCVFPDGIMYNTYKDTVEYMGAKVTLAATFAPLSDGSVFTKITATGIGSSFSKGDNVCITGVTGSIDTMFNDATKVISDAGDDYIVVTASLTDTYTESSITFERKIPQMDFITENNNRLWGCSSENHEIYCCKVGDPKNWYNYETEADNAYAVTVGSDGDFTGCIKYSTYMMFFKESTVHILRGTKPSNFSMTEKTLTGVKKGCSKSLQNINETLYYVGRDGVYAYDGSTPTKISENITGEISDAVACQYSSKLYISCLLDGTRTLLVYDPKIRAWDVEDDETFKFAEYSEGMLHFVDGDNNLTTIYGRRDDEINWELITGNLYDGLLYQKHISKIQLNLWLSEGSEASVFVQFDDGEWIGKATIRSTANKVYTVPIIPIRCAKCKLRLVGKGEFKLLAFTRQVETGSEIN